MEAWLEFFAGLVVVIVSGMFIIALMHKNKKSRGRSKLKLPEGRTHVPKLWRLASSANSSRLETPNFPNMLLKWRFTVSSLIDSF